jgi:hypothetical protein
MGPVWDFDGVLDNYLSEMLNPENIVFFAAPWFDRLITDERFVKQLMRRYAELQRGTFDNDRIMALINDTVSFLGNATTRDWQRWKYDTDSIDNILVRLHDEENIYGETIIRATVTYEQEIIKLRQLISFHEAHIEGELQKLSWREGIVGAGNDLLTSSLLSAVLIIAFLAITVIGKRL